MLPVSDDELKAFQFDAWGRNMNQSVGVFASMCWEIVKGKKDAGVFVTSDAPTVVRPAGDPEKRYQHFVAPASEDAELTFPLSSKYLLNGMRRSRSIDSYGEVSKTRVEEFNARVIRMADRYVFTAERNARFEALFERNRGFSPPTLPTINIEV